MEQWVAAGVARQYTRKNRSAVNVKQQTTPQLGSRHTLGASTGLGCEWNFNNH